MVEKANSNQDGSEEVQNVGTSPIDVITGVTVNGKEVRYLYPIVFITPEQRKTALAARPEVSYTGRSQKVLSQGA